MTATAARSKLVAVPRYSSSSGSTSGSLLSAGGAGNRKQSSADRSARDQTRITVMLITVVIVFLLCQLPQAIQHIYNIYHVVVGAARTAYQKQVRLPFLDVIMSLSIVNVIFIANRTCNTTVTMVTVFVTCEYDMTPQDFL